MKTIIITAVAFLGGSLFGWICYAVFSANITDEVWEIMMDELEKERYQKWREYEYGRSAGPIREANLMSFEEAEETIARRKKWEEEDEEAECETN